MSRKPSFTVIIPVYNGAAFLAETLISVLSQTYPPAEVIVLNDGSHDQSLEVVKAFSDRVRVISRPHSGVSATRNLGASLATTEWIHFMDHDDLWTADHLDRQAEAILASPSSDVCYSGRRHLVEDLSDGTFRLTEPIPLPDASELPRVLPSRCPFTSSAVALRRSTFLAVGGFDGRHNSVEDWDLWLRLLHHGAQFTHQPQASLVYRIHQAANTNNPLPVLKKSIGVVEQNVLPRLSPLGRLTHGRKVVSRLQAEAAILLRANALKGALPLMLRSIASHPLHGRHRYKVLLHMLLAGDIAGPLHSRAPRPKRKRPSLTTDRARCIFRLPLSSNERNARQKELQRASSSRPYPDRRSKASEPRHHGATDASARHHG